MAKALIGESFDFGTLKSQELGMPPIKDKSVQNMSDIKYDSVSGTKNAMLYNNDRAYPSYVVYYVFFTTVYAETTQAVDLTNF